MSTAQDPQLVMTRLLAEADRLYSLPAVAMKVLELTRNPGVDTHALKECLENDPALTGKILRVVNSSLFGLSGQVSDLNQSLALLGTKPLKLLVLGFSLPPALVSGVSTDVLGRYWRHTLTRAVVARELHERLFDAPGDEAFIAGLLSDLGILLLIQEVGEPYTRLLQRIDTARAGLAAREVEAMGFDHRELSAGLLAHWGLPEALVHAVDPRHRPGPSETAQLQAQTVEAAEWFARLLADGNPDALAQLLETPAGRLLCGMSREELAQLVGDFESTIGQLADILSLTLPAGRDYRDILAEAHECLSDTAADAARELIERDKPQHDDVEPALAGAVASLADVISEATRRAPDERPQRTREAVGEKAAVATAVRPKTLTEQPPAEQPAATGKAGLLAKLSIAVVACRQCRRPLSLILVQSDSGHAQERQAAIPDLKSALDGLDFAGATRMPLGTSGFAIILPGCGRDEAVRVGHRLAKGTSSSPNGGPSPRFSVGVATVSMPPKNPIHEKLLAAADRCLFGARAFGSGVVKSIEIY